MHKVDAKQSKMVQEMGCRPPTTWHLLDPTVNEAFLQLQCITKWETHKRSCFTYYTSHIAPSYKSIFFSKRSSHTHPCLFEKHPSTFWRQSVLVPTLSVVRQGIGELMVSPFVYAHYAPWKSKRQSITYFLIARLSTTFELVFHTSSMIHTPSTCCHMNSLHSNIHHKSACALQDPHHPTTNLVRSFCWSHRLYSALRGR